MCLADTKVALCKLLVVCILGWIQDRNITEAVDIGTALLEQVVQWTDDALLVRYACCRAYYILVYICPLSVHLCCS